MKADNIDKYLQNQLSGYASKVDGEALWSAVEKELNPEQKKRGFFWYWIGLGVVAFAMTTGLLLQQNNLPDPKESTSVATTAVAPIETIDHTDKENTINVEKVKESIQEIKSNIESISANKNTPVVSQKPSLKTTIIPDNKSRNTNTINKAKLIQPNTNLINQSQEKVIKQKNNKIIPLVENIKTRKEISISENIVSENIAAKEIQEKKNSPIVEKSQSDISIMLEDKELTPESEELEEEELSVAPAPSFFRDLYFGLGVRGGISNSLTTIRAFEEPGQTIRNLRQNSEKSLETIDLGIEGIVKHESGAYVSLGFDYSKYTRRMDFDDETITTDSVEGIRQIIMNPFTNESDTIRGLVLRTTTNTVLKKVYNRHIFYSIPISLGYSFNYENWSMGVEAGALINIKTDITGEIRDTEDSFYSLTDDPDNFYKNKVSAAFRAAVVIGYNIDDSFQLYVGPTFRSPIRLDEPENPIEQEQTGLGFQLGARYFFNAY